MGVGIYGLPSCKVKCSTGWNQFQVGCSSSCPRIERIDEGLELIMMGNWNEGKSHGAYWLQKSSAQQQTLGDIRMTTWISMCTEVKVKYWCQMPPVPVWRDYR
jgi:hypothetical protein